MQSRESGSAKQHNQSHKCEEGDPCTDGTLGYRKMENDDWVKFGWVLWASRKEGRQQFVLERYKQAWTAIYDTEPLLDSDGGPVNFLHNAQYTCHKPIPWLAAAVEGGPAVQPGTRPSISEVEVRLATPPGSYPQPEAGPSNLAGDSAINSIPPSPRACSTPPTDDQPTEAGLADLLKASPCQIQSVSPFTMIKGGLFPGFREYLANPNRKCLRVVFPIIPQYHIFDKNQKSTPYINVMDISEDDADAICQVDPECLYLAEDQGECVEGQVRYFCSSWVCGYCL
jgi:hypothetical protein